MSSDPGSAGAGLPRPAAADGGGPPRTTTATAADVRAAAGRVKDALDAHLAAVMARTGEQDPAVQAAFDELQAAGERYDNLLFEVYDEVTPFDFGAQEEADPEGPLGPEEVPPVVSLYLRRDYALADPPSLMLAGQEAHRAVTAAGMADEEEPPGHLGAALYTLFQAAGVDGLDEGADEAGLEPLGGTVWFVAGDASTGQDQGNPDARPFADADPARLIYRVDEVVAE